jgi:ech hydrogenase subunit A
VDYSPIFALLLVYGSAATLFFWVKWMGKILIVLHNATEEIEEKFSKGQMAALFGLTLMTILLCGGFAAVAHQFIDPYVMANFGEKIDLRAGNLIIIAIMLTLVCLFPLSFLFYGRKIKVVDPYLGGANVASGSQFRNALGEAKAMEMHNYYLNSLFPEKKWLRAGVLIAWLLLAAQITVGVIPWR